MKIGIILDSTKVSWYIFDLIKWIKKNPNLNLEVLIIQNIESKRRPLFSDGLSKIVDRILFKIINVLEKRIIFNKYAQHKKHYLEYDLTDLNIKELKVEYNNSNNRARFNYNDETINKIKKFDLDIIIRGGSGILTGKILNSSKYGIISFHHGDNLVNRGGPPGFWEVYEKNFKTGFTIQILTEQLDGGNVLKRGNFRTENFYTLNKLILIERSNHYMKTMLNDICNNGLPSFMKDYPYYNRIYKAPNFRQSIKYLFGLLYLKVKILITNIIFNKVWYVGYQNETFDKINHTNSKVLKNPKNSFLADPFIIEHNKENYIFVEEYNFKIKKGIISVYKIFKNSSQRVGVAIEENFHLSFPYIFKYENDYFMVPETAEISEIRIYRCEDFPLKWKHEKSIFKNTKTTDSIIFKHNNLWWLMTSFSNTGHGNESELQIFYSENGPLTDKWIGFKKNPVIIDPALGRNGGILKQNNKLFRVAQSFGFNSYGENAHIQEIIMLDQENFVEKNFALPNLKFSDNLIGMHHLNNNNNFTVYDFCKLKLKI